MNWRRGFFRAWVLISILWIIVWAITFWPGAESKIEMARMSNAELMSKLDACKLPSGIQPPPPSFILEDCLKRMGQGGRAAERWGGGDDFAEQAYRVASALSPELTALIAPPVFLLFLGVLMGWVFSGFGRVKAQD